jgi:hypothetical protein
MKTKLREYLFFFCIKGCGYSGKDCIQRRDYCLSLSEVEQKTNVYLVNKQ